MIYLTLLLFGFATVPEQVARQGGGAARERRRRVRGGSKTPEVGLPAPGGRSLIDIASRVR